MGLRPELDVWDVGRARDVAVGLPRLVAMPRAGDPWREDLRRRLDWLGWEGRWQTDWAVNAWHAREAELLRRRLLTEFDAYTYDDIVGVAGVVAADEVLQAWSRREVIAVPISGIGRFPGFQLDDDGLLPSIRATVAALEASGLRGWPAALWFTAGNGWLADHRPVDVLAVEPDAVVQAARRRLERTGE